MSGNLCFFKIRTAKDIWLVCNIKGGYKEMIRNSVKSSRRCSSVFCGHSGEAGSGAERGAEE